MALMVMIYHYTIWTSRMLQSEDVLGRMGIYAVPVFYIISGLTLYLLYHQKVSFRDLKVYGLKRFFRIYPLLVLTSILWLVVTQEHEGARILFLNFTGLFGFIEPSAYVGRVAWSIGNELVFYALFPVLILALHYNKVIWWLMVLTSILAGCYFAFNLMTPAIQLEDQWSYYINPFNHLTYFIFGMVIGYVTEKTRSHSSMNSIGWSLIIISVIGFVFFPAEGDLIMLVTGQNRILFSIFSIMFCAGIYWVNMDFKPSVKRPLMLLGASSYSLYMLHPLVYFLLKRCLEEYLNIHPFSFLLIAIVLTLVLSNLSYRFIERPLINTGRVLASRIRR